MISRHIAHPEDEPSLVTLVIGIGNLYRRDDAAGLAVAQKLKGVRPPRLVIKEADGEGTALIEAWEGFDRVILVDAVASGAAPGTLHHFDALAQIIPTEILHCSTHTLGVAQAIELARALKRLPSRLLFYGVEGKDFSQGVGVSAEVADAVTSVVKQILQEIRFGPHYQPDDAIINQDDYKRS